MERFQRILESPVKRKMDVGRDWVRLEGLKRSFFGGILGFRFSWLSIPKNMIDREKIWKSSRNL